VGLVPGPPWWHKRLRPRQGAVGCDSPSLQVQLGPMGSGGQDKQANPGQGDN